MNLHSSVWFLHLLPFQDSTTQSTDAFEHGMTNLLESLYDFIGCGSPIRHRESTRILHTIPIQNPETSSVPVEIQISSCPLFVQSMSLNIDMKMFQSVNSSGSILFLFKSG